MSFPSAVRTGTRAEDDLILLSARTSSDSESSEQIREVLRHDIDWAYLIGKANQQGMMPLLYWHVNATCSDALPAAILNELRNHFHTNVGRNLLLTGELLRVLKLLDWHGIPAIPYKGPILAASVYGSLALRQSGDLDLLVDKKDVFNIRDLLVPHGYRPEYRLTHRQESTFLETQSEYNLYREDRDIHLEIHWQILPRYFSIPLGFEDLWERVDRVEFGGAKVFNLSPEDLLLILCTHGTRHRWERLAWICDVSELIRGHREMDWGHVMEYAHKAGIERILFLGLSLASDLLGTALPVEIKQRMHADRVRESLVAQVRERLFMDAQYSPSIWESCRFYLRTRERWRDRIRLGLDLALAPNVRDWMILPLPAPLFALYYLLRPIRLTGKYSRSIWKRLIPSNGHKEARIR